MADSMQTPLYDWHVANNAQMIDFSGWSMPLQYTSVVHEHEAVRNAVGISDISHMGRYIFRGSGACAFLDSLLTCSVSAMPQGQICYSLLTNDSGGIMDDLLIGHNTYTVTEEPFYFLFVNARNKNKDAKFIKSKLEKFLKAGGGNTAFADCSSKTAMITVQGPFAVELLQPLIRDNLAGLKYYTSKNTTLTAGERWCFISRTGYTGEDGFEIVIEEFLAEQFMEELFQLGKQFNAAAVGFSARDTLRLEAAMPLYGHELSELINPFEAGLGSAVKLNGREFSGSRALLEIKRKPLQKVRIGLEMERQCPVHEGYTIHLQNETAEDIGVITSGTYSPTLQKPIAMGYVPPEHSHTGQQLLVNICGKMYEAAVVSLPFYSRKRSFFSKAS